ncbi:MAG: hypothetical protein ACKVON_10375 [Beijerinckiaceae bacterium]
MLILAITSMRIRSGRDFQVLREKRRDETGQRKSLATNYDGTANARNHESLRRCHCGVVIVPGHRVKLLRDMACKPDDFSRNSTFINHVRSRFRRSVLPEDVP